jgi:hypothetical protein
MKRFKSIVLTALAVFLVVSYIHMPNASAQSSSLSIPPKKNYIVEPGDSVDDSLVIRNLDATHELNLYLRVIDFTYTDDSGTPKLMLDQNAEPTTWSLRNYLKVPESVTVPAGQSQTVKMSVTMPKGIGAGSYYSAIIYSTTAPSGGNVGLAASGVTLAFVTVPGTVNENLTIKSLGSYNADAKAYQYFNFNEPKVIAYTLENKGNVTEAPAGSITLKDMFGHEYSVSDVNPSKSLALIGQTRTFQACVKLAAQSVDFQGSKTEANACVSPGLWPGLYTVSADLFYGQNGNLTKELTKTTHFWYLPLWFLIIAAIIILVLAFYIWRTIVWIRGGSFKLRGNPRGTGRRRTSQRRR